MENNIFDEMRELKQNKELERLIDLLFYPCADVRMSTEEEIISKYGRSVLNSIHRQFARKNEHYEELKIPRNWGIRKKDLECLKKETIEDIFYGTRNLYVPTEILDLEHPMEIIANYLAAGNLKRYNAHLNNEKIPRESFSELIKFMNRVAYSYLDFAKHSHSYKKRKFKISKQSDRLSRLPNDVKRKFCISFWKKYIPSNIEAPNNYEAFYDPLSFNGRIDFIMSYISGRFEKEHQ
ncbi:MAG: hypothetical protein QXW97_02530 [Candidatus Pacearchaeota archaeon]